MVSVVERGRMRSFMPASVMTKVWSHFLTTRTRVRVRQPSDDKTRFEEEMGSLARPLFNAAACFDLLVGWEGGAVVDAGPPPAST